MGNNLRIPNKSRNMQFLMYNNGGKITDANLRTAQERERILRVELGKLKPEEKVNLSVSQPTMKKPKVNLYSNLT